MLPKPTTSSGLIYKKLDLHLHTPASNDFQGIAEPSDIINEAVQKGLDGIAITDHNTANWIDKVKEAAEGKGITVFPGVEITCMGGERNIHIIALFDPSKGTEHVKGVLNALQLPPDKHGDKEALIQGTPLEVIQTVNKWGGIAVLAHANSTSGVLHDMKGVQRRDIVQHPLLLAAEGTDFQNDTKKTQKKRVVDLLNGTDPEYKRKLAVYQASDNPCPDGNGHCLEAIGNRCSYFKLEKINLEGLRQCFHDPDVRIRQDFEFTSEIFPYIKAIKVVGGFLDGQSVNFHTGLNSVLGAKGTGKSLLIELLRFGLNQESSHPTIVEDHNGKLEIRLKEYSYVEITFVDETGKEFQIKRTYQPTENNPFDVDYDPAQVLPVLFLSQNEIIKIAENEDEQLSFIDRFFDFHSYKIEIQDIENRLELLDRKMAEGLRAFPEVKEITTQIETLNEELSRLDAALKNPLFEEYSLSERKSRTFSAQSKRITSLYNLAHEIRQKAEAVAPQELPPDLKDDPALRRVQNVLAKTQRFFESQTKILSDELAKQIEGIKHEQSAWNSEFDRVKQQYEDYVRNAGGNYQELAAQRTRKAKRLEDLKTKLTEEQKKRDSTREISAERDELLNQLEQIYGQYTQQRQAKCDKFQSDSMGKLRLRILGSSNAEEFRSQLLQLKQGSYLRESEIESICTKVKPRDFIGALLRYKAAVEGAFKDPGQNLKDISHKAGIPLARMGKLADFLTEAIDPSQLLALQYRAVPQDVPEIKYNVGDSQYESLTALSVGQKSTALLIMVLSDGKMPVVIDQPEDSLDIRSIWEDICLKLRDGKERRQFVFTTHNASVAVASDTDYFMIMEGTSTKSTIVFAGSMDHDPIAEEVIKYLEGGAETYKRKFTKYRGNDRLVN